MQQRDWSKIPKNQIFKGRVINRDGQPVVAAKITPGAMSPIQLLESIALTDENGEFETASKNRTDKVQLIISGKGYAKTVTPEMKFKAKRQEISITRGAFLKGTILKDGKPVKGIQMGLCQENRTKLFVGEYIIGTNDKGEFLFSNLPPRQSYYLYGKMNSMQGIGVIPFRKVLSGIDDAVTDAGEIEVHKGFQLRGTVILSDGKKVPESTRLFIGRNEAWDSQIIKLGPDGKFAATDLPGERLSISARIPGYYISSKNPNIDTMNPYQIVGNLSGDLDLKILVERGTAPAPDWAKVDLRNWEERRDAPFRSPILE